jgi:hypothetical protein
MTLKELKTGVAVLAVVFLAFLVGAGIISCQNAKAPTYTLTEVQTLKLQLKLQSAQIAKNQFNQAYASLMDEANGIKKENKWPDNLLFDPDKLQFSAPPAALPTPPPAPAPAAKKK